ncbi:MAG: type VI secretion lipoprotein TssJ [Planctomycetes bacterium]|nr:type VI secretion lipoprotein TssJ [Planctomycetota bacterium]
MDYTTNRRRLWRGPALAALAALAGCSTYTATLRATVGDDLNPSLTGSPGVLTVWAFFLKKPDAFEAERSLATFLTPGLRDENRPPEFLAADTAQVVTLYLQPAVKGAPVDVEFEVKEVASEARHVGLIAAFQSHDDADRDERWRLVVPVSGGVAAFRVAGKRLERIEPDAPAPAEPSSGKEVQRGTRSSR